MRSIAYFALFLLICTASRGESNRTRIFYGGWGLLFADTNTFVNPGQMALLKATAIEAFAQQQQGTFTQGPSVVTANGSLAFGAYYSQSGTELLGSDISSNIGGVLGASIAKGKVTVGGGYSQSLNTDDDSHSTNLVFNYNATSGKGKGFSSGLSFTSHDVSSVTLNTLTGAVGYSFKQNNAVEINYTLNNLSDMSDYTVSGYYVGLKDRLYWAGGYTHYSSRSQGDVSARVGVIFSQLDISGYLLYPLDRTFRPTLGGVLRFFF